MEMLMFASGQNCHHGLFYCDKRIAVLSFPNHIMLSQFALSLTEEIQNYFYYTYLVPPGNTL